MRCPVCGEVPPRGANFCFACGTSLARACPACCTGQSPEARFCPECGTRLPARPGEPVDAPDEPAVATSPGGLDDEALDEGIGYTRGRESRWPIAGVVGAAVLLLAAVAGSAMWLRTPHRQAARVAAVAPSVVAQEPAAIVPPPLPVPAPAGPPRAPAEPVGQPRAEPPQSEPTRLALPERSPEAVASSVARRTPGPAERERPTVRSESPAASPRATALRIQVRDVGVEIAAKRLADGVTAYSVRLRGPDGTPVRNAAVSVRGRRADGVLVEASLDPTAEPGVYHAALRLGEISAPRLRVARVGLITDLPLPE